MIRTILTVIARVMIAAIFLYDAVSLKISGYESTKVYMASAGIPYPELLLPAAIAVLILGALSLAVGFKARIGAFFLLVFLGLATYWFHDFWNAVDAGTRQQQLIEAMKNLSIAGAMVMILANGAGPGSLDARRPGGPKAKHS